jgi:hypothetical protein
VISTPRFADTAPVGRWLNRLINALGHDSNAVADPHEVMRDAHRSRARVELVSVNPPAGAPEPLATTIELVDDDTIIVSQPVRGGTTRLIGRFEQYRITVPTSYGSATGVTRCVGRQQIPSGAGDTLYGYRMNIPDTMRANHRSPLTRIMGDDTVREAQLLLLGRDGPINGLVQRLDGAGATLICRNASSLLQPRRRAAFRLDLPDPVGPVDELVTITDAAPDPRSGAVIVDVRFDRRLKSIDQVLRADRTRNARRTRS